MGTYDGGRRWVPRIRSRPDLLSTRMTPCLPTTLDRDIDTLLPCAGSRPGPSGRTRSLATARVNETVRSSALAAEFLFSRPGLRRRRQGCRKILQN